MMTSSANDKTYPYSNESDAILRARMEQLGEMSQEKVETEIQTFISFRSGGFTFAVPNTGIREVLVPKEVVPVPETPTFVLGITSVRGEFLTVLDLLKMLGQQNTAVGKHSHLLVLESKAGRLGIATEDIPRPLTATDGEVRQTEEFVPPWLKDVLEGILVSEGSFIGVLSPEKIFRYPLVTALLEEDETGGFYE